MERRFDESPWRLACLAIVLAALGACRRPEARLIVCLGDSITLGVTGQSPGGERTAVDPLGGYPGRLQRLLGDRARVLGRGVGGAVTDFWLASPHDAAGRELWAMLGRLGWAHFEARAPSQSARTILAAVLQADHPDLVILLIGVNDIEKGERTGQRLVAAMGANLDALVREAERVTPMVLVSTLLPNRRDPAELVAEVNARIRAAHPSFLPLGESFAAAGWERLLSDRIHPNPSGYDVLADALAEELERRGLLGREPG